MLIPALCRVRRYKVEGLMEEKVFQQHELEGECRRLEAIGVTHTVGFDIGKQGASHRREAWDEEEGAEQPASTIRVAAPPRANGEVCWLIIVASDAKLAFQETEARLRQELSDVKSDLQVKN